LSGTELRRAVDDIIGYVMVDMSSHTILDANDKACRIFDYDTLVDLNLHTLVPDALKENHRQHVDRFSRNPGPKHMACRKLTGVCRGGLTITLTITLDIRLIRGVDRAIAVLFEHPV